MQETLVVKNDLDISAWYLVQIKPNQFAIAERNIARQGHALFSPKQTEVKRVREKFVSETRPLFPGYLFVNLDPSRAPWRALNNTYGVSRVVSFGAAAPSPVPTPLISGLMARCDAQGHILPVSDLKPGDAVKVTGGPFANFIAAVEELAPQQRVWILIDMLGRSTRIAVSAADLQLA